MTIPVFIAYSHADEAFRKALVKHLGLLEKQQLIRIWHDDLIPKGSDWEAEIEKHLLEARLVVFLVSADFFHSDYCHEKEMKRALERHDQGKARVVPVIVRPCGWKRTAIARLQALPAEAKPVNAWKDQDEAWLNVVDGIEVEVHRLNEAAARMERDRAAYERATKEAEQQDQKWTARHVAERVERAKRAAHEEALRQEALLQRQTAPPQITSDNQAFSASRPAIWLSAAALGLVLGIMVIVKVWPANPKPSPAPAIGTTSRNAATPDTAAPKSKTIKAEDAQPPALADVAPIHFRKLPAGSFMMGSPYSQPLREKQETPHPAEILAFEIAIHEVTQKQWKSVMGPKTFDCAWGCNDQMPAHSMTWPDALVFMNKLTELENKKVPEADKRTPCYSHKNGSWSWNQACTGFRLPTEAEWEYAARAGTTTVYSFGDDAKELCGYGNGADAAAKRKHPDWTWPSATTCEDDRFPALAHVGSFKPNAFGLHDMHGNVWEWVWDLYGEYPPSSEAGYAGPEKTTDGLRVLRGGSFVNGPGELRSSYRGWYRPTVTVRFLGFRCVRAALQP